MRTFINSGKPSDCTNGEFADVIINPGEIISMIVTFVSLGSRHGTPSRVNCLNFNSLIMESTDLSIICLLTFLYYVNQKQKHEAEENNSYPPR